LTSPPSRTSSIRAEAFVILSASRIAELDVLFKTLFAGAIGLAAGLWSAESVLRTSRGGEAMRIGAWTAPARAGTASSRRAVVVRVLAGTSCEVKLIAITSS